MKKINYLAILTLILGVLSCDSKLEEVEPQQSIELSVLFTTSNTLTLALGGAYDRFQDGDVGGCNITLLADLLAGDDVTWSGSFTSYANIFNKSMISTNGEVTAMWIDGYETINLLNAIIAAAPNVEASPGVFADDAAFTSFKTRIASEARAFRAVVYFELVRYFGESPYVVGSTLASNTQMGIPYVTDPVVTLADVTSPSRATVGEVYTNVIADLEASITDGSLNGSGYLNVNAMKAYLMKVRMQQGAWDEVKPLAEDLIDSFGIESNLANFFSNNNGRSSASIFEVFHNETDNPGVNGSLPTFYSASARGDIQVTANYTGVESSLINSRMLDSLGSNSTIDERFSSDLLSGGATNKYEDFVNTADDVPIARVSEAYLSLAEAIAMTDGVTPQAVSLINDIRRERITVVDGGFTVANDDILYEIGDFADATALMNAIKLERRAELAFEGHRYHDLVRWGDLPALPDGFSYIFPIPQREMDVNPNLVQNPDY